MQQTRSWEGTGSHPNLKPFKAVGVSGPLVVTDWFLPSLTVSTRAFTLSPSQGNPVSGQLVIPRPLWGRK